MIESAIPKPRASREGRWAPLLKGLKFGSSFLLNDYLDQGDSIPVALESIERAARRLRIVVTTREMREGIRIWKERNI